MALKDIGVKLVAANKAGFKRDMSQAEKSVKGFGTTVRRNQKAIGVAMVAMGTAIVGTMAASVKAYADAGDEVQKMALRTGFSTEALSELRHAASITGTDLGGFEMATRRMSRALVDASQGLETYERAFRRLGLDATKLLTLKPEEAFFIIAMAIGRMENELVKAATAQEIFGRQGTKLLPLLAEGAEGIARLRKEAHELGVVFDQESANKAAELKDAMTRLKSAINGVKFAAAEGLIPVLTDLANIMTRITQSIDKQRLQSISPMITAFGILTGAIGLTAIALKTFGAVAAAVGIAVAPLMGLFAGAGMVVGGVMMLQKQKQEMKEYRSLLRQLDFAEYKAREFGEHEEYVRLLKKLPQLNEAQKTYIEQVEKSKLSTDSLRDSVGELGLEVEATAIRTVASVTQMANAFSAFMKQIFTARAGLGGRGGGFAGGYGGPFYEAWANLPIGPERTVRLIDIAEAGGHYPEAEAIRRAITDDREIIGYNIEIPVVIDGREVARAVSNPLGAMVAQRKQLGS